MAKFFIISSISLFVANLVAGFVYYRAGFPRSRKWNWFLFILPFWMGFSIILALQTSRGDELSIAQWLFLVLLVSFVAFVMRYSLQNYVSMLAKIGQDKK